MVLPANFDYRVFALIIFVNGVGSGLFSSPNSAAIMSSVPARERGIASGMRGTLFNGGSALSIGIFFSLMIIGLANTLPSALQDGLTGHGVSPEVAGQVADLPPVGSLFAAFLGFNPIQEMLGSTGELDQPGVDAATLTGQEFFPHLITGPFHSGLVVVFLAATLMTLIGAVASWFAGGRYVHDESVELVASDVTGSELVESRT
jgi:hypothetical protein